MHSVPQEIQRPKNEADFERMCAQIYGVVFQDPRPVMNGRRGQNQGGVDVFVTGQNIGRIGIQCKKYTLTPVTWNDVETEVRKADNARQPIKQLLLATTAAADADLRHRVHQLSDTRCSKGLFSVDIDFWDDICNHIDRFPVLQDSYAPNNPGAAYYRQEQQLTTLTSLVVQSRGAFMQSDAVSVARHDSVNAMVSAQLDHTNDLLKVARYVDALEHLATIGVDFAPFDRHQQARWHLQRGTALWLSKEVTREASEHFLKAYTLYPDDDRIAAGHVRALLMQGRLAEARSASNDAVMRFPMSHQVWLIHANLRLIEGEAIGFADVPSNLQGHPDVLMLVALSAQSQGNFVEANRFAMLAAQQSNAGYHARATALHLALEWSTRRPLHSSFGEMPKDEVDALAGTVAQFEPRRERLWLAQADTVAETAGHLGFALLLQQRFEDALQLARDAESYGHHSPELMRTRVCALAELRRSDELRALASARVSEFGSEALITLAEFAADNADLDLIEASVKAARSLSPPQPDALAVLTALRWEALHRAGRSDDAAKEILGEGASLQHSLVALSVGARILKLTGHVRDSEARVNIANKLVTLTSPELQQLMLADLLYGVEKWSDAAKWYARFVTPGRITVLLNKLLTCYVRGNNRRKAKELLSQLPPEWTENGRTRSLAIELGQQAGDWAFLQPLADVQVRKASHRARSWLFKLVVNLRSNEPAQFQEDLRNVPEVLEGDIHAVSELARLELRYGEPERGLRRLYGAVRESLDDPEALSAYFLAVVTAPSGLSMMEAELTAVIPGSAVTLVDDANQTFHVIVDPQHAANAPKRSDFFSPDSSVALALLGSGRGQRVEVPTDALGGLRHCTVTAIQTAYRRLFHLAQEQAASLAGLPNVKSVPVGVSGDRAADLASMVAELKRSGEHSRALFDDYARGTLTLAGLAALQGRIPIELILGWPIDGPTLFVAAGTQDERESALALLARDAATYVVDSATLAELVNLGMQDLLTLLPKIFVTPQTKAMLEYMLADATNPRKVGTAAEVDGQVAVFELEDRHRAQMFQFANDLLAVVEQRCSVQPGYGEVPATEKFPWLAEALHPEELEVLFLAQATGSTVLSVDGRLRALLQKVADIPGVFPQALLMHGVQSGVVTVARSTEITAHLFLTNRGFVSLRADDLIWLVMQGGHQMQSGIHRFTRDLAAGVSDFQSTVAMCLDFLSRLVHFPVRLGAFGELLSHLVEAALRNPQCPAYLVSHIADDLSVLMDRIEGVPHPYPPADAHRRQRIAHMRKMVSNALDSAAKRAALPPVNHPVRLQVLYCTVIPTLIYDAIEA